MTEKELKKLNRQELLEVLLAQSKKIDRLQNQLKVAQDKLTERELDISEAGSIAEASLVLNNVFADAQRAADQYLENIRRLHDKAKRDYSVASARKESGVTGTQASEPASVDYSAELHAMREQTAKECEALRAQAADEAARMKRECAEAVAQVEAECAAMRAEAQNECEAMKARADKQIRFSLIRTKKAIRQMLGLYANEVEKRMRRLQRWDRQTGAMHERKTDKKSS